VADAALASKMLNWSSTSKQVAPAMVMLFHDRDGKMIDNYVRLKPDKPRTAKRGGNKGKPIKYESPLKKPNRAYFPLGIESTLADASNPLLITEGEKKALKSSLAGFPCIGLVGIWGWVKKRERGADGLKQGERQLIDDLAGVNWICRHVIVAFDSDAAHNLSIQTAERCLAESLLTAGVASVKIVRLPDMPDGNKCGLDDFLVANPTVALQDLIDRAPAFSNKPGEPGNDSIVTLGCDEHRVNDEVAKLLANDPDLYQSGWQLVRVLRDEAPQDDHVDHQPSAPRIEPVPLPALRDKVSRVVKFVVLDEEDNAKSAHPPAWCINATETRGTWPGVRQLDGVVPFPILRSDGSILCNDGYDPRTRLYLHWPYAPLPLIEHPTRDDAVAAGAALIDVVSDFPFLAPVHRAAWLAGLLTPLARSAFNGNIPMFMVDANVRGSGKGKVLDAMGMIVLGSRMAVATYPKEEDELRKKITACLIRGDRLVLLDNLTGQFGNGTLDALLTSTTWSDRILGESRMYGGPALATWYATGNNVSVGGDTARRICHVRLESPMEKPEERSGFRHPDLLKWVGENRPRLLAAALTILRAYVLAGKPDQNLKPWGGFEAWSGIVRNAITWIGLPDPGETRQMVQDQSDATAIAMKSLLTAIEMIDPERVGLTAAEIVRRATPSGLAPDDVTEMLHDALGTLIPKLDGRVLGYKLRHLKRRIFDGRFLDTVAENRAGLRWASFPAHSFRREAETSPSSPHHRSEPGKGRNREDSTTEPCGDAVIAVMVPAAGSPKGLFDETAGKTGIHPANL